MKKFKLLVMALLATFIIFALSNNKALAGYGGFYLRPLHHNFPSSTPHALKNEAAHEKRTKTRCA